MKIDIFRLQSVLLLIILTSCAANSPEQVTGHQEGDRTLIRTKPTVDVPNSSSLTNSANTQNNKHALLIGIGQYNPPYELDGPPNDVEDLKNALVNNWGYANENITKLIDDQATKKNILNEIKDLQERTQPGDEVFIYFSGHGTSAMDEHFGGNMNLPYSSGAIVTYDINKNKSKESLIVGRTDLKPLLTALDQGNRRMLVVFDSCYSGNSVRSLFSESKAATKSRFMKLSSAVTANSSNFEITATPKSMSRVEPYPYRNIVYMSAAQENEPAADIPGGARTFDGQAHGAFTDALLRILNKQSRADLNSDGNISLQEVYESAKNLVAQQNLPQTPMALPINGGNSTNTIAAIPFFQNDKERANPSLAPAVIAKSGVDLPLRISVSALSADEKNALSGVDGIRIDDNNPDIIFSKNSNGTVTIVSGSGDRITDNLIIKSPQQIASWLHARAAFDKLLKQAKAKTAFTANLELGNGLAGTAVIEGQRFNFTLQTERPAYLLLLSINAQNQINVLYPFNQQELVERNSNQAIHFPGTSEQDLIEATAPFGSDQLLLLAFDASSQRPAILDRLVGLQQLSVDSAEITALHQFLEQGPNQFAASTLSLVSISRLDAQKLIH